MNFKKNTIIYSIFFYFSQYFKFFQRRKSDFIILTLILPPLDSHAGGGHTTPAPQARSWSEVYLIAPKFRGVETAAEKICLSITLQKMVNDKKVTV